MEIFVISWAWSQKVKGDLSRFSATELEMRLGGLTVEEQRSEDLKSVSAVPLQEWHVG